MCIRDRREVVAGIHDRNIVGQVPDTDRGQDNMEHERISVDERDNRQRRPPKEGGHGRESITLNAKGYCCCSVWRRSYLEKCGLADVPSWEGSAPAVVIGRRGWILVFNTRRHLRTMGFRHFGSRLLHIIFSGKYPPSPADDAADSRVEAKGIH